MSNRVLPLRGLLFFLALFLSAAGCRTGKELPLDQQTKWLEMNKGGCFGRCPIFQLTIYTSGIAAYRGERNTPKLGLWTKKLTGAEMDELRTRVDAANLWGIPSSFPSRYTDLPMVRITQYEADASKTVSGKENRPADVINLEQFLDRLADGEGWTLREPVDFGLPDDVVPNMMRVQLKPGVYRENWVLKYQRQDVRIVRSLPERSNYWLITFNTAVTFPRELEQLLTYDEQVEDFSFEKKQ